MVVNFWTVYVARTDECAKRTFERSEKLGLKLDRSRFIGMTHIEDINNRFRILVDDADYIIRCHPELGYNLIAHADVITIVGE
jgi:hypothetical protein